LIATWINIIELSKTPNLIDNVLLVKNAVKALYVNHSMIITENPFDYIIKSHFPEYTTENENVKLILTGFEKLIKIDFENISINNEKNFLNVDIEDKLNNSINLANQANIFIENVRANIKQSSNKKIHREIDTLQLTKNFLQNIIEIYSKEHTNKQLNFDWTNFDWTNFDLLLFVIDNYFKELELTPNMKFDKNDWYDLLMLAYVGKYDKFWTNEKRKWYKVIEQDSKYSQYLYKK